ncbi:MAG TPA: ATP-binding protein [Spirochaetota bacterium]|nr:ATP-binding protein [Spirochaetota bacterium]HOL56162.1 ATP-binding protein [Spirochaetota bacterium]HPP03611.1 ATP-binding protein [Spirochaetota bacterium]
MTEYNFFLEFSSSFLSGEYNQFILSGNIYDIFKYENEYYNLIDFLVKKLSNTRLIIKFNIAEGVNFVTKKDRDDFIEILSQNLTFFDKLDDKRNWVIKSIASSRISPLEGLRLLKEAVDISFKDDKIFSKPFAILIEHAETVIPEAEISRMFDSDRQKLVFLRDWLTEDNFIKSNHLMVFISQTVSEIQRSIVNLPAIKNIVIDYPDFEQRKEFIQEQIEKIKIENKITIDRATDLTAGLNLNGIKHILMNIKYKNQPLTEESILSKTEEAIIGTIGDYIRVINPDHGFEAIYGARKIKEELLRQVKIIKLNDPKIIPRGYLICGRNGVGKTYIMEAFAKELGWLCIELKNLRQKYLGETDIIFERVKNVLESFKNVMVFIDEADTMFGGRGENVHETEKRLTGNFIKMMGDPKNRGRIIWVFITSRPDLLLPDFIRRLEIKIGFFNPKGEDRIDFLKNILNDVDIDYNCLTEKQKKELEQVFSDFSPAEFKMLSTQLKSEKKIKENNKENFIFDDILKVMKRFNLGSGREKYLEQDQIAREYSTFVDLID